ncbi:uncharacterized protein LOC131951686 [Physella acuta]|uniref:uncharacterized protein LOC131951686 n=1 Tax=Physella acuta TaxID=109671 RepID=UPI0027DCD430|nr:uncharacterized protein LOC131951686 [Physella acuta]
MSLSEKMCQNLNKIWADQELCDFTVEIDEVSIRCHRVILGASSPFFLGLLRSGMKEANEGHVVLQDVSVSTFQLILKALYTGEDVLSLDNFIEIWHAVDMLQIGSLVELCESFAAKNIQLENFRKLFSVANLFNSKTLLSSVKKFMTQNIEDICRDKLYLEFSFDEMSDIVRCHALNFRTEYPVLEMVLNWVQYKPVVEDSTNNCTGNNNKFQTLEQDNSLSNASSKYIKLNCSEDKSTSVMETNISKNRNVTIITYDSIQRSKRAVSWFGNLEPITSENFSTFRFDPTSSENLSSDRVDELNILLSQVRMCIICPSLLMNVLEHRLIKNNDKACQIIVSALLKQMSFRHGQWPKAGIYRQCQEYGNYGISCMNGTGKFLLIDLVDEKRYTIKSCKTLCWHVQISAFDKELYATSSRYANMTESDMFVYRDNTWTHVAEVPGTDILLASNEQYVYATSVSEETIYRLNSKCNPPCISTFSTLPEGSVVKHFMSYQIYLLIFCTETGNGVEETAVHMLDLQAKSWTKLDNLNGPAKNIISFRNDDNHFVLQRNGNLWVLRVTGENIRFTYVAKLWNLDLDLCGAVVYGEKLVIFYKYLENGPDDNFVYKIDNVFQLISYSELASMCSKLIPVVLPKSCLSEF